MQVEYAEIPIQYTGMPNEEDRIRDCVGHIRLKKIDKTTPKWAQCCVLTCICISAIGGAGIGATLSTYSLLYVDNVVTTSTLVISGILTGAVGAVGGGLAAGFSCLFCSNSRWSFE